MAWGLKGQVFLVFTPERMLGWISGSVAFERPIVLSPKLPRPVCLNFMCLGPGWVKIRSVLSLKMLDFDGVG